MTIRLTQDQYIEKAKLVHNNKYDYSLLNYVNGKVFLDIICPIHGMFSQRPDTHLKDHGCPKCGHSKKALSIENFIDRSNVIHNNKYDYSKVEYLNTYNLVIIICPIHGEFLQRPDVHLRGHRCPKCNESFGEVKIKEYLNSNSIEYISEKKFLDCINPISNWILRFDFYLPEYNLCIEYDGQQHFKPIFPLDDKERAIEVFENVKQCDSIKNKYCLDNSIRLLRISYTKLNNIYDILERELK